MHAHITSDMRSEHVSERTHKISTQPSSQRQIVARNTSSTAITKQVTQAVQGTSERAEQPTKSCEGKQTTSDAWRTLHVKGTSGHKQKNGRLWHKQPKTQRQWPSGRRNGETTHKREIQGAGGELRHKRNKGTAKRKQNATPKSCFKRTENRPWNSLRASHRNGMKKQATTTTRTSYDKTTNKHWPNASRTQ